MAEGFISNGVCFASRDAALDNHYSSANVSVSSGPDSYYSSFEKVNGSWVMKRYKFDQSGVVYSYADVPAPSASLAVCDPTEKFFSGLEMGGLLSVLMVAAFCSAVLRKAL